MKKKDEEYECKLVGPIKLYKLKSQKAKANLKVFWVVNFSKHAHRKAK
jgi:hypothetical protein